MSTFQTTNDDLIQRFEKVFELLRDLGDSKTKVADITTALYQIPTGEYFEGIEKSSLVTSYCKKVGELTDRYTSLFWEALPPGRHAEIDGKKIKTALLGANQAENPPTVQAKKATAEEVAEINRLGRDKYRETPDGKLAYATLAVSVQKLIIDKLRDLSEQDLSNLGDESDYGDDDSEDDEDDNKSENTENIWIFDIVVCQFNVLRPAAPYDSRLLSENNGAKVDKLESELRKELHEIVKEMCRYGTNNSEKAVGEICGWLYVLVGQVKQSTSPTSSPAVTGDRAELNTKANLIVDRLAELARYLTVR